MSDICLPSVHELLLEKTQCLTSHKKLCNREREQMHVSRQTNEISKKLESEKF